MKSGKKKRRLSVKYNPLPEGGMFDIKPPRKNAGQPHGGDISGSSDWWRFFTVAFIIFALFTFVGIYTSGREFLRENKYAVRTGYDSLMAGAMSLAEQDFYKAGIFFGDAEKAFKEVDKSSEFLTVKASGYLKSGLYIDAAGRLIESGGAVSRVGREVSTLFDDIKEIPEIFISQNLHGDNNIRLTDLIKAQKNRLDKTLAETLFIQKNLAAIKPGILPKDLADPLVKARNYTDIFLKAFIEIEKNFSTILNLLGDKVHHSYLVLLQNNRELRATGGFIGTYMLIDVNDGEIIKMETKDVYETDGQLTDIVQAPPGIDKVADRLYMRDANYNPDFPESARQIMWFLEHSKGPSVDTVIAIDQTVAEKLLEITGPIKLKDFPLVIHSDNFNDLFSYHIESKLSNSSTPKQLLIDFIPVLKEKLFSLDNFSALGNVIAGLAEERHVQVYSKHENVQELARSLRIDGKIIPPSKGVDFLSVITTSIGGNKSDAYIKTEINHATDITGAGDIVDILAIKKNHTWQESDFSYWEKLISLYGAGRLTENALRYIHGEGDNLDYMRVYVPKGSRLLSIEGADSEGLSITDDMGYTVFGFTFGPVKAGESKTVKLSYKLPYSLNLKKSMDVYRFIAQKQAGAENITLKKTLRVSDKIKILDSYPKAEPSAFSIYPEYETQLSRNEIFLTAVAKD